MLFFKHKTAWSAVALPSSATSPLLSEEGLGVVGGTYLLAGTTLAKVRLLSLPVKFGFIFLVNFTMPAILA